MAEPFELQGDWAQALELLNLPPDTIGKEGRKAVKAEALILVGKIKQQFVAGRPAVGEWAPLSQWTKRSRKFQGFGGTKMLIRSGDLMRSVQMTEEEGGSVLFVGVHRTRMASDASGGMKTLANLGAIHEFGKTIHITVTRKMQAYFFAMMGKQRGSKRAQKKRKKDPRIGAGSGAGGQKWVVGSTMTIRIPARPFIAPAVEVYAKAEEIQARVAARVIGALWKRFGGGPGGNLIE